MRVLTLHRGHVLTIGGDCAAIQVKTETIERGKVRLYIQCDKNVRTRVERDDRPLEDVIAAWKEQSDAT